MAPPWRGSLRLPPPGDRPGTLDIAAHHLPTASGGLIGGDWYDAMELPDGRTLLTVGDLTGHALPATSAMSLVLGALRGMAVAGIEPGALMGHLDHLLESSMRSVLGSALCCRYDSAGGVLSWAQAGHPPPLLFRDGAGRQLPPPDGVLLGAGSQVAYEQDEVRLLPGDVLVLHTDGLTRRDDRGAGPERLLALAPGSPTPVRHRSACGAWSRSSAGPSTWTTRVCWSPASGRDGARGRPSGLPDSMTKERRSIRREDRQVP